jgi:hypothetical protein
MGGNIWVHKSDNRNGRSHVEEIMADGRGIILI